MAHPNAYKPPKPSPDQLREDFRKFFNGWSTRLDGGRRAAPAGWNVKDRRLFGDGWDAADRQEAMVDALMEDLP